MLPAHTAVQPLGFIVHLPEHLCADLSGDCPVRTAAAHAFQYARTCLAPGLTPAHIS